MDDKDKPLTKDRGTLHNSIISLPGNSMVELDALFLEQIENGRFQLYRFHVDSMAHWSNATVNSTFKYDRFVLIDQNAVFCMESYSLRKNTAFNFFAFAYEVIDSISVIAANNVLSNNGAFIQIIRDIMSRSSNKLDSSSKARW